MVEFNWSEFPEFDLDEFVLNNWMKDTCDQELRNLGEVSVVFCTDEELLQMNRDYLDHDYYTDIITFDYCEDNFVNGDLFISVDRVNENASDLKIAQNEELSRVMIHGLLHLCGYGDKTPEEERVMREKEEFYLIKLKGFT